MTKHTFVILAYNGSPFLMECVESLLRQSVSSKLIIVTSTPNDLIGLVSRKYDIPLYVHSRVGIGDDWSYAYKIANSEYVTLAHQDDVYLPDYTEKCLRAAEKRPDNLITFTGCYEPSRSVSVLIVKKLLLALPYWRNKIIRRLTLSFGNPIPCPTVMFHKTRIGLFSFNGQFNVNLDWDAWLRLSNMDGLFLRVKDDLVMHRIHTGSQTAVCNQAPEDRAIFQSLWPKPIANVFAKIYSLGYR
jgi:glycosyltransferase involved in cell wall biosynthesis